VLGLALGLALGGSAEVSIWVNIRVKG